METVFKAVLPLFIGMALIGCAGTDSSMQTKVDEKSNLFKAGTPFADSLVSKAPEFAHSVFKGVIDSVPGEYYYHTTDGKIDTLFKKESGQHKPIVSIAYDSPNEQNSYELKKGNYSYFVKNGVLEGELNFPKSYKIYWSNGKPREVLTGILYKDDQGIIKVDSGHSEIYFENGKIKQQNDWKNYQLVTSKEWNENGVLITEGDFPKYIKTYWDNGSPQIIAIGLLYKDSEGVIKVDSGHQETYFENGKIYLQTYSKNKQIIAGRIWNEKGVLIRELDFPKHLKEYWDNGMPKATLTGLLCRGNQDNFDLDSGHQEIYFENGKIKQQNDWENKQIVASKVWNENGILVAELVLPKYYKEYWDNGKPKTIATGLLYRDSQGISALDSGHSEVYFENGKISEQNDWKDKQNVASKVWNENGILVAELALPKYYKEYWNNGKPKFVLTGLLYRNDQGDIALDSGRSEIYFENGKVSEQKDWKDKQIVAIKQWNESGGLVAELDFPKYYKEYWDNGKVKVEVTGIIAEENGDFKIKDGVYNEYDQNGEVTASTTYKDFQIISEKK